MHGYWRDPAALKAKIELFKPAQVRFETACKEFFQGRVGSIEVDPTIRVIKVRVDWLAKMTLGLGSGKTRRELWESIGGMVEDQFNFILEYRFYYYQSSRGVDHRYGPRPERIKVVSHRESFRFLIMDDPFSLVDVDGRPTPRFMEAH